jgi:hypothetical protein
LLRSEKGDAKGWARATAILAAQERAAVERDLEQAKASVLKMQAALRENQGRFLSGDGVRRQPESPE